MSRLLSIDSSTDLDLVGELGSYLAILKRKDFNIADGFIIPVGERLENGLSNEVMRYFDSLNAESVVLRSSSVVHDMEGETIRDVRRDALISAIHYLQRNIARRGRRAAIVIQKNINAELSGTAYSINPSTRDHNEILIEAHLWMNSTVLSGESEPDVILVRKNAGALILEGDDEREICLDLHQIARIYNAVRKIERFSSVETSIDWAFDDGELYILRIRPITEKLLERFQNDTD